MEKALLERLGCSTENLVCYASGKEVRKHRLETEIGFLAMNRKPLTDKLKEYRELAYVEKGYMSGEELCRRYPPLLLNRAKIMKELENDQEVLSLCEKGIRFCTQYSRLAGLPDFYYFYAVALERLGRVTEAADSYGCAASLYRITGSTELAEQFHRKQGKLIKCSNTENPAPYPPPYSLTQ